MIQHVIRGCDKFGCGHYGAKRGDRLHKGVDLVLAAGEEFESLAGGKVTKLGYCYKSDLTLRYVQVTTADGSAWRFFYVLPGVKLGQQVKVGDVLGNVQSLQSRYPGITDHVHFEIMRNGDYVDPTPLIEAD